MISQCIRFVHLSEEDFSVYIIGFVHLSVERISLVCGSYIEPGQVFPQLAGNNPRVPGSLTIIPIVIVIVIVIPIGIVIIVTNHRFHGDLTFLIVVVINDGEYFFGNCSKLVPPLALHSGFPGRAPLSQIWWKSALFHFWRITFEDISLNEQRKYRSTVNPGL